jgi:hypothetical protein
MDFSKNPVSSIAILSAALACTLTSACASSSAPGAAVGDWPTVIASTTVPLPEDASVEGASAQAMQAPSIQGSSLCNASAVSCLPDNPQTSTAQSCIAAPDGGAYAPDASYANWLLACHVTVGATGIPQPACLPAGTDEDGAPCAISTDCAAGSECVGTPGICRHYCCLGDERCSNAEFCDVEPIVALVPTTRVPVCIPLRPCGLLGEQTDAGTCPSSETCAVARLADGATSCVPVGAAGPNESCLTDHCARGLTCLGGHCYTLCHVAAPVECPSGETCAGGLPVFVDPAVGVCQADADAN